MEVSLPRAQWRKRSNGVMLDAIVLLALLLFLLFLVFHLIVDSSELTKPFLTSGETLETGLPRCRPASGDPELSAERFLWYAPHSGFSNQISELKNALVVAAILRRTLIVPPVLDHHAVALGSCPKFRVSSPSKLRTAVWDHIMELLRDQRFVSIADIVDLSPVTPSMVKTIDFRIFASKWCGLNMSCSLDSIKKSFPGSINECKKLLSGLQDMNGACTYALEEDCRTTVWTYQQNDDEVLDSFQPDPDLQKRKKISYFRMRRDLYKALGNGSKAELATVLAFGSMFSAPYKRSDLYFDVHEAPKDYRIQSLLNKLDQLTFVPEIINAGKKFAVDFIKSPYLCAQLRLLDGQFKNHWEATFSILKQKVESLRLDLKDKLAGPLHIFIMTDLPRKNWAGTYLSELENNHNSYILYTLQEHEEFVKNATMAFVEAEHGLRSSSISTVRVPKKANKLCEPLMLPNILLYIEEAVCSCASLGFVGTSGSTIADSIERMRRNRVCVLSLSEPDF